MKKLASTFATIVINTAFTLPVYAGAAAATPTAAQEQPTQTLPLFALKRAATEQSIDTNIDRPIIVQFWATWCKNCGETMAFLDKRNNADFNTKFYTVAVDDEASAIKAYLNAKIPAAQSQRMLTNTFIDADASFAKQNQVSALPHVVVMDTSGKILLRHIGHPDEATLAKMRALIVKS